MHSFEAPSCIRTLERMLLNPCFFFVCRPLQDLTSSVTVPFYDTSASESNFFLWFNPLVNSYLTLSVRIIMSSKKLVLHCPEVILEVSWLNHRSRTLSRSLNESNPYPIAFSVDGWWVCSRPQPKPLSWYAPQTLLSFICLVVGIQARL